LYKDSPDIDCFDISQYIKERTGGTIRVQLRDGFLTHHINENHELTDIAGRIVGTKVFDLSNPSKSYNPFPVEIAHEKKLISGAIEKGLGVMYDGLKLMTLFRDLLPKNEQNLKYLHVIFTNRLVGTWNSGDGRYHARVSVYGFPSIISTTGVVEAPARPKEFYKIRRGLVSSGMVRELVEEELKSRFRYRFVDYGDERTTEIIKGYVMQAFFYQTFYEPFCKDRNCRLYNAHWQEDMVHAQLEGDEFCKRHEDMLKGILERK
jgi:hypothetical protein